MATSDEKTGKALADEGTGTDAKADEIARFVKTESLP